MFRKFDWYFIIGILWNISIYEFTNEFAVLIQPVMVKLYAVDTKYFFFVREKYNIFLS